MIFDPMANAVKDYVDSKTKSATDTANTKVSKSGDTMTGDLILSDVSLQNKSSKWTNYGNPSVTENWQALNFLGNDNSVGGRVLHIRYSDGNTVTQVTTQKGADNVSVLAIHNLANGAKYATAPSSGVSVSDSSDIIMTTSLAMNHTGLVHSTGNEQIAGKKTFTSDVILNGTTTAVNPTESSNDTTVATTSWVNGRIGAIPTFSSAVNGLVPKATSTSQFLRGDGKWATPANTEYGVATTTANGLMSSGDKVKLNGIATGAQVNILETIKVNGTALTPTSKAVDIEVPSVGNATLTIQKNGASVGTFTANATSNATINITVPTKTSQLTNDSGFRTSDSDSSVMQSEPSDSDWSSIAPNNAVPILLRGVDTSGTAGGVLYDSGVYVNPMQNAILATSFTGTLYGNASTATKATTADSATKATTADSATKATQDGNGNVISSTYATKAVVDAKQDRITLSISQPSGGSNGDIWFVYE